MGREAELALAAAAVRQLSEGRASALVIEGEAGIGKTRLVQSIVDDARSRDVAVFCGQAHPFERTRPFGVVAAALDLSRRSPDPRRAAIGALLAGQGAGAPARAAGDIQYRVVEEIVDLVETSCAERPVLLVAEDIHWADSASLLAILSVARQLPLAALLVVVTARPSPLPAEVVRLLDDLAAGGARTLHLQPLKSDDVAVLAGHVLGASPGPALTAMLAKAGGNPLWAVAMLRSLADEGMLRRAGDSVEATTSELPASLSDLVVRRLRHLPTATLELLQVTAVLGDAVSLRDVAAVARRPPAEVVGQLGDAFDAQLLDEADDRVVFRHQLVHDAIYQHMPPPARRLLHREAAVALMAAGADRLDVADHLMLGAERGDEQAVAWLRDAAREASAQAPLVTVELLRRAEALLPGGHRDADLVSAEVVQALLRAGKVAEASARAEAVLARQHAAEVDTPLRLALARRAGSAEPRRRAHHRRAGQPRRPGPAPAFRSGADAGPAELGSDVYGRPPRGRIGRQPGARHRRAGGRCGDDGVGPDGVDGGGGAARPLRRGAGPRPAGRRPGCRLARHAIAAAPAEVLPRPGAVRLRPCRRGASRVPGGSRRRVRLGVVALRDADGRRSGVICHRGVGGRGSRPDRRRPGRAGEGQPAAGVTVARLPGHHRDGRGRSPGRERAGRRDRRLAGGRPAELQRGSPRVRGGGAEGGRGRPAGRL